MDDEVKKMDEAQMIEPLHDLVLVRLIPDDRTEGGIVIPSNAEKARLRAVVVAVGPGKLLDSGRIRKPDVPIGATVLVNPRAPFAGVALHSGSKDQQLALVDYESIWAIDRRRDGTRSVQ